MTKEEVKSFLDGLGVKVTEVTDEIVADVEAWKATVDTETRRQMRIVCVVCSSLTFVLGVGVGNLLL